jgi:hypothetical protein
MSGAREFLDKPAGKAAGITLVLIGVGMVVYVITSFVRGDPDLADSRAPWFVDSETGKPFHHQLVVGDTFPVLAPSGKNTGYPAELCYWTKDGTPKTDPTPVLLNSAVGKPGPTFCPDCGRLVVSHNPAPTTGGRPPPTEAEYKARHSNTASPPKPSRDGR